MLDHMGLETGATRAGRGKGFLPGSCLQEVRNKMGEVPGPYEEEEEAPLLKVLSCLSVELIWVCLAQLR